MHRYHSVHIVTEVEYTTMSNSRYYESLTWLLITSRLICAWCWVLLSSDSTRFCFCEQQHRPLQQWTVQIWLAKALWSPHLPELWEWYQLRFELHISYHLRWQRRHQLQFVIAWIPWSMLWAVADWQCWFIKLNPHHCDWCCMKIEDCQYGLTNS